MAHRPPIDTTQFMSRYHHPKNIAGGWAPTSTAYSNANGTYRQKQVDDEIARVRSFKRPSSSKITITIDSSNNNLMQVYHHHHHCLDIQLTGGRSGKGRVVWFWQKWETATDERVMKGVIAALDSSWSGDPTTTGGNNEDSTSVSIRDDGGGTKKSSSAVAAAVAIFQPSAGEKRKRAAVAAVSRTRVRESGASQKAQQGQSQQQKKKIDVIDLC